MGNCAKAFLLEVYSISFPQLDSSTGALYKFAACHDFELLGRLELLKGLGSWC